MSSVGVHAMPAQTNAIASNGGPATKKVLSNGSSGGPTPAGTPVQNGTSLQGSSPPPLANAPKYGKWFTFLRTQGEQGQGFPYVNIFI